ncbi:hypothetical protein DL771_003664 [Monosporascus sp. 5C6A]|nr:hypothetical protein DL771_003664 [Monosporascus sp. 5C6A]
MSSTETTFRAFHPNPERQLRQRNRRDYHPSIYQSIISYHTSAGGQFQTLLTQAAVPAPPSAPSPISSLQLPPIRFEVSSAEDLGAHLSPPVEDGSVDLITAATAAHWFDMPSFWRRASPSTPKADEIQAAFHKLGQSLKAYIVDGNRLSHELYADLRLPWTVHPPVPGFDEASFVRKEWGTGDGSEPAGQFYASQPAADLDTLEMVLGTTSPVVRLREDHPEMAGTERDLVRILRREIEGVLHQAGVDRGKELIRGGVADTPCDPLAFNLEYLRRPSKSLKWRWYWLYRALVAEKYRKIIFLSSLLYAESSDHNIVQALMALGSISIFFQAEMFPPSKPIFDLTVNGNILSEILAKVVRSSAKRLGKCPESDRAGRKSKLLASDFRSRYSTRCAFPRQFVVFGWCDLALACSGP